MCFLHFFLFALLTLSTVSVSSTLITTRDQITVCNIIPDSGAVSGTLTSPVNDPVTVPSLSWPSCFTTESTYAIGTIVTGTFIHSTLGLPLSSPLQLNVSVASEYSNVLFFSLASPSNYTSWTTILPVTTAFLPNTFRVYYVNQIWPNSPTPPIYDLSLSIGNQVAGLGQYSSYSVFHQDVTSASGAVKTAGFSYGINGTTVLGPLIAPYQFTNGNLLSICSTGIMGSSLFPPTMFYLASSYSSDGSRNGITQWGAVTLIGVMVFSWIMGKKQ